MRLCFLLEGLFNRIRSDISIICKLKDLFATLHVFGVLFFLPSTFYLQVDIVTDVF